MREHFLDAPGARAKNSRLNGQRTRAIKPAGSGVPSQGPISPKKYTASIFPHSAGELSHEFVRLVGELEKVLGKPVWLIVQGDDRLPYSRSDGLLHESFVKHKQQIPQQEIAVLVDSPGGWAEDAYQVAMLLRRRCKKF